MATTATTATTHPPVNTPPGDDGRAGIVITDARHDILAVNPVFSAVTGYSRAEVIGKNPRVLSSGLHDAAFYQSMWDSIETTGEWCGEITNRHKDGTEYAAWLSIFCMKDDAGAVSHYVGTFTTTATRQLLDERLNHLGQYDALTNLPNRTLLLDRLGQALLTAERFKRNAALLWIDLTRFRTLNDTYGHGTGDAVLREVAQRLAGLVRQGDSVARLSGDEFCLLMANLANENDVIVLARHVIDALSISMKIGGNEIGLGSCIGISLYPKDGADTEALLKAADVALVRAKGAGQNNFRFFTRGMDNNAERRLRLESDLRAALAQGQITLHYQPQVDLTSGRICGTEALMRWRHPVLGPISPVEFIPLAEETGLILPMGAWAINEVCRQNRAWQDAGLPSIPVAVNLSVKQFHQANLVDLIAAALASSGLHPALLEIEITESAFVGDVEDAAAVIKRIKALGVQLSLDDFGTGYSSLSYLSRFPFDKLKIDQSFVRDIIENPTNAAIATATIAMARSLNLVVLAEGVETDAQMEFLRARHCEVIQGYLFSRPLPAAELTALLGSGLALKVGAGGTATDTLLIVDDEPNILTALQRLLRRDGYTILTASSPAIAFDLLAKQPVQVIISDQRMPEMSGIEFLARVKQIYPETIRIALSGYADIQSVTDAINRGAIYRFLTKPWDDAELRAQIREAFRVARGLAHA